MGKWVGLLIVAIIALAILGFVVDAVRVLAWAALVVLVVVLGARMVLKRNR